MTAKTLSVSAIENGTVIDHIPAGQGLHIIRLLQVQNYAHQLTIGLNLSSASLGRKDIIKIHDRMLTDQEACEISLFAPHATINIIAQFKVEKKITDSPPKTISTILMCPNSVCISRHESIRSFFYVHEYAKHIRLQCKYCEKIINHHDLLHNIQDSIT